MFTSVLSGVEGRSGIRVICQKVARRPPGAARTRPTYLVSVGYQFPDDRLFANLPGVPHVPTVIPVEVSFGEVVCGTISARDRGVGLGDLTVCSLEDIFAEKLRALLQQVVRNRRRKQDVYDLAAVLRAPATFGPVSPATVAAFLERKVVGRGVEPRRSKFRDPRVRERAAADYDRVVRSQTGDAFIPFAEAWRELENFLDRMPLDP